MKSVAFEQFKKSFQSAKNYTAEKVSELATAIAEAVEELGNQKANKTHSHAASDINSGTLPITRGGTGNTTGNAATATKLKTARTIRTNLASTSSSSFDGTANITPGVTGTLPIANGGTGNTTGNAATATKLQTARTIDGMPFDGSANIVHFGVCETAADVAAKTVTVSSFSYVDGARIMVLFTKGTTLKQSTTLNVNNLGAKNIIGAYNRWPSNIIFEQGNIVELVYYKGLFIIVTANAISLANARSIRVNLASTSSTNFDGSANITPGVTGTLPIANGGTGNTTGNAATATKLKTVRTIDGMNFDGSTNIVHFGICNTAANVQTKEVSLPGFILAQGARVAVYFANNNTASSPMLNINGTGAHFLASRNGNYASNNSWIGGDIIEFVYYSNHWIMLTANARSINGSYKEGYNTTASGDNSHAEGNGTLANGTASHAEGYQTTANGQGAHAEGWGTQAIANDSHAEGYCTTASGIGSHAEGDHVVASGERAHAGGSYTKASAKSQMAIGKYNKESTAETDKLIIGNGTSDTARSNCLRVTDTSGVYSNSTYKSSGADYAETFEWEDGNTNNEDRTGLFVTLTGDKIRLATPEDSYILGIVSACPSICGDVRDDTWNGMFLTTIFGSPILEEVEVSERTEQMITIDENGEEVTQTIVIEPAHTEIRQKLNPEYDHTKEYIPRSERPEWDAVGVLGKLVAVDDGSCEIDGWCKVGQSGIATKSEEVTKYRVMKRLDETHIKVFIV